MEPLQSVVIISKWFDRVSKAREASVDSGKVKACIELLFEVVLPLQIKLPRNTVPRLIRHQEPR